MNFNKSIKMFLLIIVCMQSLLCSDRKHTNPLDPEYLNGYEPVDPAGAVNLVQQANSELESKLYLYQQDNFNIEMPNDVDFTIANSLYNQAIDLDATNPDANFGVSLTDILILSQDMEINSVFNEWKTFLDNETPFLAQDFTLLLSRSPFPTSIDDLYKMSNIQSLFLGSLVTGVTSAPRFSELQDLLSRKLLPVLEKSVVNIERVDENKDYTFVITPKMQGDLDEDYLELDMTEIYALQTSLYTLKAFCEFATAYHFWDSDFDSTGIVNEFKQDGSFMTLKSDGKNKMAQAKSDLLLALDKFELGITFLQNEQDNQNNDVIKIGDEGTTQADLDSAEQYIQYAKQTLNGNWTYTFDWDDNSLTPDSPLTINLGALFSNPPNNFKDYLPAYTISVVRDTLNNWYWEWPGYYQPYPEKSFYCPQITWQANSYNSWIFPDPSINGLLPGMTDSEFKSTFGLYANDWNKVFTIVWSDTWNNL